MGHSSPMRGVVLDETLIYQQDQQQVTVLVGISSWFSWLETATSFTFKNREGSFTAHKARASNGRGGWYWYAYRRRRGQLFNLYLGSSEKLTLHRLREAVHHLTARAREMEQPAQIDKAAYPVMLEGQGKLQSAPQGSSNTARMSTEGDMLLRTKLTVPLTPAHFISRPRLLHLLRYDTLHLLTLVSAPAGWGKTTLLSEWARASKHPVAWVSLHKEENDPSRFLAYLLEALRLSYPIIENHLPAPLMQKMLPEALAGLINGLAAIPEQIIIILDNYHVIQRQAIHDAIRFLLEYLPPHAHLVLATRSHLPFSLARIYVHGQVMELHANLLRFTPEEMRALLIMVQPTLTGDEVAALERATEGWAAGLHMALLMLREKQASAQQIAAFTANSHYLQCYLIEEVLDYQPAHIQTFLFHTAFLERFNGPLCGAVIDQSAKTDVQEILAYLEREQLFLLPIAEDQGWYRYHHLFRQAIYHYLEYTQPDLLSRLHRQASQWFEEHDLLADAINHRLAAQDVERAATLIERIAYSLLANEEIAVLQRWLAALPSSVIRASPQLCVISAWLIFLTTQAPTFLFWLDMAEEALQAHEEVISPTRATTLHGEIVALRAANQLYLSDIHRAIATCNQVLASLSPDNLYARSLVLLMLGLAYQRGVNVAAAAQALSEANSNSQAIGHGLLLPYVMIAQAELYELQGYPFEAMKLYHQVLQFTNGRIGHPTGIAYASLGYLFWEWLNMETARQYLHQAWDIGLRSNNNNIISETALWLVQVELTQGHTGEANVWLQQWEKVIQEAGTYEVLSVVAALRARISLEQGRLDDALLWMQNHMPAPEAEISPRHDIEYFVQVRVLIAAGRAYNDGLYLQQAMTLLEQLRETARTIGRTKTLISVLIFQALVLSFQEDINAAFAPLELALTLAEPGRYIRVFVDKGDPMMKLLRQLRDRYRAGKPEERTINLAYVRRLLASFSQPAPQKQTGTTTAEDSLLEPLSWREQEVLRLVAAGRKNQEIARELVVVTGTVKAHINSIYRKLAVTSRIQAITRARALHLL